MKAFCASLALATVALFSVPSVHAQTAAFVTSGTATGVAGTGLVGFEFTVNQDIDLTQLGFFAEALGGDTPHVALLNVTAGQTNPPDVLYDTGNIISDCSTVYPAGTLTTGSLTFNYVSVGTPIELFTGQTYEITAPLYWTQDFSNNGTTTNGDSGFTLGSVIQTASFMIGGGWNGWDNGNGVPTQVYDYTAQTAEGTYTAGGAPTGTAHVSANFLYTTIAVPEPQTWAMFFGGIASLAFFRRTFRRK